MARRAGRRLLVEDLTSRRRISIYRKGQSLVAQLLDLAELKTAGQHQDILGVLASGLADELFPTEQLCNDVLTVIMAGGAAEARMSPFSGPAARSPILRRPPRSLGLWK